MHGLRFIYSPGWFIYLHMRGNVHCELVLTVAQKDSSQETVISLLGMLVSALRRSNACYR